MRGLVIDRPMKREDRAFLRVLSHADAEFILTRSRREKLAACSLVQAGYASAHPIFPDKYAISPRGQHYLDRLARAH